MTERPDRRVSPERVAIYRHPIWVRVTHWLNVLAVLILIMSGLQILRAHPHLYWGLSSTFDDPWISFGDIPGWLTIPNIRDLAGGRRWHFFFAWLFVLNGLIYLVMGLISRRFAIKLWPTREDLAGFWGSVKEHARFHFPHDEEARRYNVIQKLTYLTMIVIVLPMMLLTGLSMSPGFNAVGGFLLDLFGGRQSARTLHFISGGLIVGFIVVHVGLVVWTGLVNNMRAMITGWFEIDSPETAPDAEERPADECD